MTAEDRRAAVRAFEQALIQHDIAVRLNALERRLDDLERFPEQLAHAVRVHLQTGKTP